MVHLALLALLLMRPLMVPAGVATVTELELVVRDKGTPPQPREAADDRQANRPGDRQNSGTAAPTIKRTRATATGRRPAANNLVKERQVRVKRVRTRQARAKRPGDAPALPPGKATKRAAGACSPLAMRCDPGGRTASKADPRARARRFRSFYPRRHRRTRRREPHAPRVASRLKHRQLEALRYADGGRLLRATGTRRRAPGIGEQRMLTLANSDIGGRNGRRACDVYHQVPRHRHRLLVLMVDTSGSVVARGRHPAALVCAAGAALSALDRGYRVSLVNFSSETRFLKPTRDIETIYGVMSQLQRQGTRLPPIALLKLPPGPPRDYVLISDGAIANLERVLPGYGRALRADRKNRGLFFLLGKQRGKEVASLERVGFRADEVERQDGSSFRRYASSLLRRLLPGAP